MQIDARVALESEKTRNLIQAEISSSMTNGWGEYRRLIMAQLESLEGATKALEVRAEENGKTIASIDAGLKARAGVIGGVVAAVVAFITVFVQAFLPDF